MKTTIKEVIVREGLNASNRDLTRLGWIIHKIYVKERKKQPETKKQAEKGKVIEVCAYPPDFGKRLRALVAGYFIEKNKRISK